MFMKIAIGSDHAGYKLKEAVKKFLLKNKIVYKDFGTYADDGVDYPDIAKPLAKSIRHRKYDFGVLICGTGNGMAMAANKVRNVRAAVCDSEYLAQMARAHNDANVLCLGARVTPLNKAIKILNKFIRAKFEKGRHLRRVKKLEPLWY